MTGVADNSAKVIKLNGGSGINDNELFKKVTSSDTFS
jgi:hypothetical protein